MTFKIYFPPISREMFITTDCQRKLVIPKEEVTKTIERGEPKLAEEF